MPKTMKVAVMLHEWHNGIAPSKKRPRIFTENTAKKLIAQGKATLHKKTAEEVVEEIGKAERRAEIVRLEKRRESQEKRRQEAESENEKARQEEERLIRQAEAREAAELANRMSAAEAKADDLEMKEAAKASAKASAKAKSAK